MKKYFLIFFLFVLSSSVNAQEEWGSVDKNRVTLKEIAPVWPGCENMKEPERENCFDNKLAGHISRNFRYPAQAYKNNEQGRVVVEFLIDENGKPVIKNVSGGSKSLQEEAKRNILSIPKMAKPGMLGGKPRAIQYTVPITFKTGK